MPSLQEAKADNMSMPCMPFLVPRPNSIFNTASSVFVGLRVQPLPEATLPCASCSKYSSTLKWIFASLGSTVTDLHNVGGSGSRIRSVRTVDTNTNTHQHTTTK